MSRQSLTEWLQNLPVVWAFSNPNGQSAAAAEGGISDDQVDRVDQAVKQRMPDECATDALPYVGDNSGLIQGAQESDDTFRARTKDKDAQWALAGTWAELLFQLQFTCGLPAGSAYIVQQNGQAYSLTLNLGPTDDPTEHLLIQSTDDNLVALQTPWWTFDDRDDLCSRFALVIDSPVPSSINPTCRATFTSSSSATATWPYPFDGSDYYTLESLVSLDGTTPTFVVSAQDRNTITITTSAPFTGYVDIVGWPIGGVPFAGASQSMQNLIELLCNRWKPAKARFMGAVVVISGAVWGWPIGTNWGDAGLKWGTAGIGAWL